MGVKSPKLTFIEVKSWDSVSLLHLEKFYSEVYIECFKDINEVETLDNLLYYLKQNKEECKYTILLGLIGEEVVCGCIFDYFRAVNSVVIEFIVVKEKYQSNGIGFLLYNKVVNMIEKQLNNCKIFCEIDKPKENKGKYLYFWDKLGYKRLDFVYIQPSLSSDKNSVYNLWLVVKGCDVIDSDCLLKVIYNYMKYCMQIDNPLENKEYISMKKELKDKKYIELLNLL